MERALMEKKTDKLWEQMGKVNWETETLKTNQKEILEIKTIVIEGKDACYGFMSIYDRTDARICEGRDGSMETLQTQTQGKK